MVTPNKRKKTAWTRAKKKNVMPMVATLHFQWQDSILDNLIKNDEKQYETFTSFISIFGMRITVGYSTIATKRSRPRIGKTERAECTKMLSKMIKANAGADWFNIALYLPLDMCINHYITLHTCTVRVHVNVTLWIVNSSQKKSTKKKRKKRTVERNAPELNVFKLHYVLSGNGVRSHSV